MVDGLLFKSLYECQKYITGNPSPKHSAIVFFGLKKLFRKEVWMKMHKDSLHLMGAYEVVPSEEYSASQYIEMTTDSSNTE